MEERKSTEELARDAARAIRHLANEYRTSLGLQHEDALATILIHFAAAIQEDAVIEAIEQTCDPTDSP